MTTLTAIGPPLIPQNVFELNLTRVVYRPPPLPHKRICVPPAITYPTVQLKAAANSTNMRATLGLLAVGVSAQVVFGKVNTLFCFQFPSRICTSL